MFVPKLFSTLRTYDRAQFLSDAGAGVIVGMRADWRLCRQCVRHRKDTIGRVSGKPKVLIIRMRHVPALDSTGMRSLRDVVGRTRNDGTVVIISEAQAQPLAALRSSVTIDEIGADNVVASLDAAFARAKEVLSRRPSAAMRVSLGG